MSDAVNIEPEEMDQVNGGRIISRKVRPEDRKRLEELKKKYEEALKSNQPVSSELLRAYHKQLEKVKADYPMQF